jgi:cytoplasmic FMR1 interacting protein
VYDREGPRSDAENLEITNLALNGLRLLCNWTSNVVEVVAWKLLNPTNSRNNPDCPANAETYELATKYNYQPEEKSALVEVIKVK